MSKRACTCLGTCRGSSGLGPDWYCVLERNGAVPEKIWDLPIITQLKSHTPAQGPGVCTRAIAEIQKLRKIARAVADIDTSNAHDAWQALQTIREAAKSALVEKPLKGHPAVEAEPLERTS